jgi:hypothetical protein
MAKPTLTEVFGANATQDATTITISKTDLAEIGLTATANNTAESILAALVLKAGKSLTVGKFQSNPDCLTYVDRPFNPLVQRGGVN